MGKSRYQLFITTKSNLALPCITSVYVQRFVLLLSSVLAYCACLHFNVNTGQDS